MSIAPNPADPRVRRTRQLLQDAFMELLGQRAFESITVQDIAERATVNRATFYAHFEDKNALLDSMIHEQFRHDLEQKLPASPNADTVYALAVVVFDLLGQVHGHCAPTSPHVKPLFEAVIQREAKRALLDWLQRSMRGSGRLELQDAAATALSWALFGAALQWAQDPQPRPTELAARQVVDMLMAGVSRSLGLEPLASEQQPVAARGQD